MQKIESSKLFIAGFDFNSQLMYNRKASPVKKAMQVRDYQRNFDLSRDNRLKR